MKNRTVKIVVLLGGLSIMGILAMQLYWFKIAFDQEERKFSQTTQIALLEVLRKIRQDYNSPLPNQNPITQLSTDYYVVNVNDRIDSCALEFYLKSEFEKYKIFADFEYGIYDCTTEKLVYGKYIGAEESLKPDMKLDQWPLRTDMAYYFVVRFPGKFSYLAAAFDVWFGFLAITVLAISFFVYAISVILNQKRLSEIHKDFVDNITHEFKTPLASIRLATDYFKSNPTITADSRLNKYTEIIGEQGTRLNQLVESILLSASLDNTAYALQSKEVSIKEVLQSIVSLYQLKVGNRAFIRLHMPTAPVLVEADEMHLTNMLTNLLDNAIKYSNQHPDIDITRSNNYAYTTLTISDKGLGIEEKHLKKIFKKFYRVPRSTTSAAKGFGLGLYYVHSICRKHSWKLDLQSQPGIGTTVWVQMPALTPVEQAQPQLVPTLARPQLS
jgi:two-component system, OmpR family, phosphate regulon sensor histidine kinase PhoR